MRRRRRFLGVLAIVFVLITGGTASLWFVVKHEPAFYRRMEVVSGPDQKRLAQEFTTGIENFFNLMNNGQPWMLSITQEQLNCHLPASELFTFPEGVTDVRVEFDADRLRIGFRYGSGWSAVIVSVDCKTWLVAKEPNVIALELCGVWVGGLPLGSRAMMDYVADIARYLEGDVTWYRSGSHPVALLRLQANQSRPTLQLRRFEIQSGKLMLSGRPVSDAPPATETAAVDKKSN